MLSDINFQKWCKKHNLSQENESLISNIRSSPPSRNVGGGSRNVSGKYPSKKMARSIQFESHRIELPIIYMLEHDPDVLEYYDQPGQINKYRNFHKPYNDG